MNDKIIIHTFCERDDNAYVNHMWNAAKQKASDRSRIDLRVHTVDPAAHGGNASKAHAAGCNDVFSWLFADDPDQHIICDADTVLVFDGWDNVVMKNSSYSTTGISHDGPAYEGNPRHQKGAPGMSWIALQRGLPWNELRFDPFPYGKRSAPANYWHGLKPGVEVLLDVSWELPGFLEEQRHAGRKDVNCNFLRRALGDDKQVLVGLPDVCYEEFQLFVPRDGDNAGTEPGWKPFVVHQRSSRKHPYRSAGHSATFYDAVDAWEKKFTTHTG